VKSLVLSVSMFSVVPVRSGTSVDRRLAARALLWLPLVGVILGALALLPALAVWRGGGHGGGHGAPLLAAVLIVAALALLTRGLHLDGLADLADGLGSRQPGPRALEVMSASDIGPFGVAALVLTLLLDVAALACILAASSRPAAAVSLIAAVVVGRLAALWAAGRGVPAARSDGFGAMVAGSAAWPARIAITVVSLAAMLTTAVWAGSGSAGIARLGGSCVAGLVLTWLLRRHAVSRLGGMTGDVFGALIEIATTVTLVVYAGALAWR
jgi:adenosylcobinamide-GDP ribazoletransferase